MRSSRQESALRPLQATGQSQNDAVSGSFEVENAIGITIGAVEIARYVDPFIRDPDLVAAYFALLQTKLDWTLHPCGRRGDYWWSKFNRPHVARIGKGMRTHRPKPDHWVIALIRQMLEKRFGFEYEGCLVTQHISGHDFVTWHGYAGVGTNYERPIAIVTLGSGQEIAWRRIGTVKKAEYVLAPGSLLILNPQVLQTHEVRIPRSFENALRLTLTFRSLTHA
jgi:hypothetical protein